MQRTDPELERSATGTISSYSCALILRGVLVNAGELFGRLI
jgi:hypothetical protein